MIVQTDNENYVDPQVCRSRGASAGSSTRASFYGRRTKKAHLRPHPSSTSKAASSSRNGSIMIPLLEPAVIEDPEELGMIMPGQELYLTWRAWLARTHRPVLDVIILKNGSSYLPFRHSGNLYSGAPIAINSCNRGAITRSSSSATFSAGWWPS